MGRKRASQTRLNAKTLLLGAALATAGVGVAQAADQVLLRAREGTAAMLRGQYDQAVALYDEALGTPDVSKFVLASIYSDRGVAKWRMRKTKEAIDDFNESIQLAPDNAIVYNNRGNALMDLGHPKEAIKDFDRAIALEPSYGAAFNNRGNAYASLQNYDAAFQSFRKATALLSSTAAPYNGRGRAHIERDRYHAAVRDLGRSIKLDPKLAAAYRNRAVANFELGNFAAAAADASQALDLEPERDKAKLLMLRARAHAAQNRFREGVADFDQVLDIEPEKVDAFIERGALLAKNKRHDAAIRDFDKALALEPKNAKAYALRGETKLFDRKADKGYIDVNIALILKPNDPQALRIRGDIFRAQKRNENAVADYQKAVALDPFQEQARATLVRLRAPVPADTRKPLGEPVAGWVINEKSPGRFVASNSNFRGVNVPMEMFGGGQPRILSWQQLKGAQSGIGLLKYNAGAAQSGGAFEYVAVVDTRKGAVLAIEPERWGDKAATWEWQTAALSVTDPDGNVSEVALRPQRNRAAPVARRRRSGDGFFGFAQQQRPAPRPKARRRGGRSNDPFRWLFR
ncbi:MAG: tetratricopeptide repeat protein [Methyloceanibacter sp.]|nr:tetratricopeptide repeat protein [Methyloceanibacter sp.]